MGHYAIEAAKRFSAPKICGAWEAIRRSAVAASGSRTA